jgi:hypothetical protein
LLDFATYKWKRRKSTQKNTRNDEFTAKLFDAKYENNFELVKTFIDGGKVDVNMLIVLS